MSFFLMPPPWLLPLLGLAWRVRHPGSAFVTIQVDASGLRHRPPTIWDHDDGRFAVWAPFRFVVHNHDARRVNLSRLTYGPNWGANRHAKARLYLWNEQYVNLGKVPGRDSSDSIDCIIAGTVDSPKRKKRPRFLKVRILVVGSGWRRIRVPLTPYQGHKGPTSAHFPVEDLTTFTHHYELRDVDGECEVRACLRIGTWIVLGRWTWQVAAERVLVRETDLNEPVPVEIVGPKGERAVTGIGHVGAKLGMNICATLAGAYEVDVR